MAVLNLGKIFKAGIKVAMGTDSGAQPLRVQGFSEHLELELMMQAGLSALDVISVATANSASVINKDAQAGLLAKGKNADFMILTDNPADNIKATRKIAEVWKNGKKVVSK
jgi:imidazolonepropionase-like amidohydrolase